MVFYMEENMIRRMLQVVLALGLLLSILAGCGSGAPSVDWTLEVTGDVATPLSLSYADLAAMPQIELTDVFMEKSEGEDLITAWSGVAVDEIWKKAGVTDYVVIVALAADGYALEIPKSEMEGAIIALKDAEGWIANTDKDHGPIRIVCPKAPANRWVFQLTELQVVGP
jgi:DMSO/TMAO reductase YedYZ molybdopterin-dependent catalytic subunit